MIERVHVFLDWQNIYMRARDCFHPQGSEFVLGQVNPADLGHVLAAKGLPGHDRRLDRVHVYRGAPDQRFDARGFAAYRRQLAAWSTNKLIEVHAGVIRYPEGWVPGSTEKPREKGRRCRSRR